MLQIKYVRLDEGAKAPVKAKHGDAAYDLYSVEDAQIEPMYRRAVRTGLAVEIPEGYYGRIAPRSGLASKNGIMVMGGVVDSSYRGEISVILANFNIIEPENSYGKFFGSRLMLDVKKGDRIAQLIIERCYDAEWKEVSLNKLGSSEREDGGFGSTGQ